VAPLSNADFSDIQGLLRFGYGKLTDACFLLLRIDDPAATSNWLESAPVTTAEVKNPPPSRALQIAFTVQGLKKLQLPDDVISGFSAEFISGMTGEDNRSRRLGDIGSNAPDNWLWGSQGLLPDVVVLVYAESDIFEEWKNTIKSQLMSSGCTVLHTLSTTDMGAIEPFGFVDGVSTPVIDWERKRDASGDKLHYENVSMLGEFVLGYPNEYGKYTTRPILENSPADLPNAEDVPDKKDLGRNGTYLVIRQIDQDIHGFWQFLYEQTGGNSAHAQELAERFVGRRMSGESLLPPSQSPIEGVGPAADDIRRNQFNFDSDSGVLCPFGAHIRRANPRNADLPPETPPSLLGRLSRILSLDRVLSKDQKSLHTDRVASTRFHRLIRRGREYGPVLMQHQRQGPPAIDEPASGLHFICLNANIGRQFEFIQSSWLQSTTFDGLRDENDPLVGNRETLEGCPASKFSLPVSGGMRQQIHNIPRFITVRGGAYFFLPGIRALRYIARSGNSS
jgi:deferrochelatase/peroxidase EfeB